MKYIIELEKNVWFNGFNSDPERTLIKEHASQFKTKKLAKKTLKFARQFRPFKNAKIIVC